MSEDNRRNGASLKAVIKGFREMTVPDVPAEEQALSRLAALRRDAPHSASAIGWRVRLGGRLPYVAAASVLLLVGGVAIFLAMTFTSGVAMADVIRAAQKHSLVRYKQTQVTEMKERPPHRGETISMVYGDLKAPRFRIESSIPTDSGELLLLSIQDGVSNRHLMTNSLARTATVLPNSNTKPFLDNLRDFQDGKNVRSTKVDLNGRKAIKYERQEANATTTLWVDSTTELPVRLEHVLVLPSPDIALNTFIHSDFEWDPEAQDAEQLFSTTPPAGFTVDDRTRPSARPATVPTTPSTAPKSAAPTGRDHAAQQDIARLRGLERRVRDAAKMATPAVVAVQQPRNPKTFASGVIISAEGLILSQYHVSHETSDDNNNKSLEPGARVKVILQGDRECQAVLLGADRTYDLSLLRLVEPGPYSYTPLTDGVDAKVGDPVLKLGHPGGYRVGRDPVVRLGHVLCRNDDSFVADCRIDGGDSGGPLYDLDGRLIGIIRGSALTFILRPQEQHLEDRKPVTSFAYTSGLAIRGRLDSMLSAAISSADTVVTRRLIEDLVKAPLLPVERWTGGAADTAAYRTVVKQVRESVVAVVDGNKTIALGTVVAVAASEGIVVTKASVLPKHPKCRLRDGITVAADVMEVDRATDIALLKITARNLRAIEWASTDGITAGTFVAAAGFEESPLTVGVVSVALRQPDKSAAAVFEHDMPLRDEGYGGPVVNLSGKALGITTTATTTGAMAVPADQMESLVQKWTRAPRSPATTESP